MATTIDASFQKLKGNLEITGLQKSTVSTRQQSVREVLEADFTLVDSFLTGSYSRSTMIAPLGEADVDIFVVLSSTYYESNGQASILDKVRRTLLKTYTKTPKISRNGQAVTITFTDFLVDVVPAFNRQGGGYLIPNSTDKRWISTNPEVHVNTVSQENASHQGMLVPLVKMIKGWNRSAGFPFNSFYLELLAVEILRNVTISDYPSGMRYFLDKGREKIRYTVRDLVPYGGDVYGFRNVTTVQEAVGKFELGYNRAVRAEDYARKWAIEAAVDEWRKIFGDYFPAYG